MILSQLLEKRTALLASLTALVDGDITPEKRTQFDAVTTEITVLDSDIARVKAVEEQRAAMRNPVNQPRPDPSQSNDPEERAEVVVARQKSSLREYMRTGKIETRDLTVAAQGVAIPIGFDPTVIEAQKSYGQLLDIVRVIKTDNGNPIKMVLDNDTVNGLVSVTVGTAQGEVDPTLAGVTLQVSPYSTGVIKVDNGFLTDAGFDVDAWIRDRFLNRFFRGASSLMLAGDGGNIASLLTGAEVSKVTSGVSNTLGYADLVAALGLLDPAYHQNAVWAMSNLGLASVLGISDSNLRPLFLPWVGNASLGFVGTILGYPVKLVTQLPAVATGNYPVLFGDFQAGYTFRMQNPGIGILRLNELFAAGYETGFVGFARIGGVMTDAGTHPVISVKIL